MKPFNKEEALAGKLVYYVHNTDRTKSPSVYIATNFKEYEIRNGIILSALIIAKNNPLILPVVKCFTGDGFLISPIISESQQVPHKIIYLNKNGAQICEEQIFSTEAVLYMGEQKETNTIYINVYNKIYTHNIPYKTKEEALRNKHPEGWDYVETIPVEIDL